MCFLNKIMMPLTLNINGAKIQIIFGLFKKYFANKGMLRVRTQIGQTDFYCDIATSNQKDLNLIIGKEIYLGFNAMSVATLKL